MYTAVLAEYGGIIFGCSEFSFFSCCLHRIDFFALTNNQHLLSTFANVPSTMVNVAYITSFNL